MNTINIVDDRLMSNIIILIIALIIVVYELLACNIMPLYKVYTIERYTLNEIIVKYIFFIYSFIYWYLFFIYYRGLNNLILKMMVF